MDIKTEIEEKAINFIKKYKMIKQGENITVALSGGADSVCLLLLLNNIKEKFDFVISAVHVNHHIRGAESDRDAKFCEDLCEKYNIKEQTENVDCLGFAKENKIGTEEAGRILRYKIFSNFEKIATAHTASDNLETSLYNFMRGSGLRGISGIPPCRDNIIRPLLEITRSETENYVKLCNETFVTDSTNLEEIYSRNRIRHRLIPEMKRWNGNLEETSIKNIENFRSDLDFIEFTAKKVYNKIHVKKNKIYIEKDIHPAIFKRCLIYFLKENEISYDKNRIETIENIAHSGGSLQLGNECILEKNGEFLEMNPPTRRPENVFVKINEGENVLPGVGRLHVKIIQDEKFVKSLNVHKKSTNLFADCDKIKGNLILRNRRYGDSIIPAGRGHHVKIKKWLQSEIPKEYRENVLFICDDEGLIAVEGLGVSDRVKLDEKTKRIVEFEFEKNLKSKKQEGN